MLFHTLTARLPFAGPRHDQTTRRPAGRLLIAVAGLALLLLTILIPATAVGAQTAYPPNVVLSTYFDARYGEVSVITDASGNVIDINAATGQRIYPVYPDYASGAAYTVPSYTVPAYAGANSYGYSSTSVYGAGNYVVRQYTDTNSNCTNGAVTQTVSGYYCTGTGTPAYRVA